MYKLFVLSTKEDKCYEFIEAEEHEIIVEGWIFNGKDKMIDKQTKFIYQQFEIGY